MTTQEKSKYLLAELTRKANYAIARKRRSLVYETYGMAKGMYFVDALELEDFSKINDLLVVNTINSHDWRDFK